MNSIGASTGLEGLLGNGPVEKDPQRLRLKQTCREFEAVMVSIVLKEGLNGASEMGKLEGVDDGSDSGSKSFKDMAYEQMSYFIGKSGMLGLGDQLYNSMKDRLPPSSKDNIDLKGGVK